MKIVPCPCYNLPNTTGLGTDTKVGITLLQRAGLDNQDQWPMARKSGHIALESNTKGFVITRTTTDKILDPKIGMMIYDTENDCVSLYNGTSWHCIVQSCND